MVGLGIVLMISALYGSYGMAGRVSAVFVVVQAVCSPQLAKFVDRYGQAKVMRPAFAVACLGLAGLVAAAVQHASEPVLYATAAVSGATIGSVGALVRRSEEHTSELQSRGHLVCRLLLVKQKLLRIGETLNLEHIAR